MQRPPNLEVQVVLSLFTAFKQILPSQNTRDFVQGLAPVQLLTRIGTLLITI